MPAIGPPHLPVDALTKHYTDVVRVNLIISVDLLQHHKGYSIGKYTVFTLDENLFKGTQWCTIFL